MKDKNCQLAIFGDFGEIVDRDVVAELADLKDKYGLEDGTAQDFEVMLPGTTVPVMRQALYSMDKNMVVVFGSASIRIEENLSSVSNYDGFLDRGLGIMRDMIDALDLEVKRIACNGSVIGFERGDLQDIYRKLFSAKSFIYDDKSSEWDFSTNKQAYIDKLECTVNQILRFIRGDNIVGSDGTAGGPLVMMFDYNTSPMANKLFNNSEIGEFVEGAKYFKQKALELCMH